LILVRAGSDYLYQRSFKCSSILWGTGGKNIYAVRLAQNKPAHFLIDSIGSVD
jgi:hypothetical protein